MKMKATREHCIHYALSAVGLANILTIVFDCRARHGCLLTGSNTWEAMQLEQCLLLTPLLYDRQTPLHWH
ncbi:hypothetical protein J6590_081396 [Homalodisca vitripennis]|nr:hypothetical protein J6590_081396 [Homalodisca vitripennis]